jgi:cytochrome c5
MTAMVQTVIKGKGAMPPKGGDASLTEDEIRRAVAHMANQSGGSFKVPAAPAGSKAPSQTQAQADPHQGHGQPAVGKVDGKAVYDKVCFACHAQSVAGSPKLGDKAAWAPRLKQGTDAMVQSVIKGKGAMPPKAGNPALSEAEIRAVVEFMASQSK